MSARLTDEVFDRQMDLIGQQSQVAHFVPYLRADRAAIRESERDLLAALERLNQWAATVTTRLYGDHNLGDSHDPEDCWHCEAVFTWDGISERVRAAIANAHRRDANG